ncbi:Peptidoglycan/LPS O-acetylase OafA/YrhL, contains acyltransferase and SGNH-hydrolase domains [Pseudomonas graminis]|uniref:Peptidoglycan/LPS O-acetylase OafA/YrhL, contains acyltransferase and SGNH-hydrolase domains n=2 Tax=Pseudomonas graminis TaxID=158627 RepID=A0A1I0B9M8_9PSED|nr:Peptidoglycan/LPS O-acetylase OafA/YrhL, contains acyltransferase and SGNH-hydrolase domains [Pseudomonas graminis]
MSTLGDLASRRNNNFNLIRMLAATAVLISHGYPLALGHDAVEPLSDWLGLSLGDVAVITFFCISGFFISLSRDRADSTMDFLTARFLRIYPGLTLVLLLSVFLIGPMFTTLSASEYFRSGETYGYATHNLTLLSMKFHLPGVFENNPWPGINGSLWTLFYEVAFYMLVSALGASAFYSEGRKFAGFLMFYAALYVAFKALKLNNALFNDFYGAESFFTWSLPFVLGMSFYRYRQHIQHRLIGFLPFAVLAVCTWRTPYFFECFVLVWTYLIFYLGFATHPTIDRYNQLGDYSYGAYIYGFPIQEILADLFKGIGPLSMMLLAFPLVILAAIFSWHFIERPAMARRRELAWFLSSCLDTVKTLWPKAGKGSAR